MHDGIADLKAACAAASSPAPADMLRMGATTWLFGRPARAEGSTIALAQDEDFTIIVNNDDVLEAEKHDDFYLVKVGADTNVLVMMTKVVKAGVAGCGCEDAESDDTPDVIAANRTNSIRTIKVKAGRCWIEYQCQEISGRTVCFVVSVTCRPRASRHS